MALRISGENSKNGEVRTQFFHQLLPTDGADEPAESPYASETRGDALVNGDQFDGDGLTATVTSLSPVDVVVGLNTWTVTLSEGDGGCTLTAEPFMPDHGHSASVGPITDEGAGEWRIEDLRISMGGYWQVELELTCAEQVERVTLEFCVDA